MDRNNVEEQFSILKFLDNVARFIGWFILITAVIPLLIIHIVPILTLDAYDASVVIGTSEWPKLMPGDIIFIQKTKNLNVGDIGCYVIPSEGCSPNPLIAGKGDVICHDVIEKKEVGRTILYRFKGCNNEKPDPCLIPDYYVIGKVIFKIPFIGVGVVPFEIFLRVLTIILFGGYI